MNNILSNLKLVFGTLVAGLILGWLLFTPGKSDLNTVEREALEGHENRNHKAKDPENWTCSMHPQIKVKKAGNCPICGMDLIPLTPMVDGGDDVDPNEMMMSTSAAKLAAIQTIVVRKAHPEKIIRLQGKIQPDERRLAVLTARFGGRIEKLGVNFTGQRVKKNQILATIYSPDLVTAQRELLEAVAFKDSRPALYEAAKAKLKLWDLTSQQVNAIEQRGKPLLYFDVLSPISGTVFNRYVTVGDYVNKGDPMFKVVDLTTLWALFDAYESDLPWISVKDDVKFTIAALPGKSYTAEVSFIDPFVDSVTRVAGVRVVLNNPELDVKPEMFISGDIHSKTAASKKQILIPKTALLWTGKRSVVYVKIPDRENPSFRYRQVVLGPEAGAFYVVEEGLIEGEEIAVNGVFKIDAAAQLQGLPSMMNPEGGLVSKGHNHAKSQPPSSLQEVTSFSVGGNCQMCKERIEKAAKSVNGVLDAKWNIETKELEVILDDSKPSIISVHEAIAEAGHDTNLKKARDEVYDRLHDCCKYERDIR